MAEHILAAAKPGCWRYLLVYGTRAIGAAEFIVDEKAGNALKLNPQEQTDYADSDSFADQMLIALREAEKLPQVKKQDYELRYLDMHLDRPYDYVVAAWLHGQSDDIIIPLPPTWGWLNDYQPYSESQFTRIIKMKVMEIAKH